MDAEGGAGDGCDAGFFEQAVLQVARAHAGAGDVWKRIECAARIDAAKSWQLVQHRHDGTAALVEGCDHCVHGVLRTFQRRDTGVLRCGIDARMVVYAQPRDVLDQLRWPDRETEAPAGHRVGFRPAIEHDQAVAQLGKFQQRNMFAPVVQHLRIDLVPQDGDMGMFGETRDQLADLDLGHRAAGRIAGRVENDQRRARRDAGQHFVGRKGKLVFLAQYDRHSLRAGILDHRAIDRKAGVGIHDLGFGRAEHQAGEKHGRLTTRHDHDVVGADLHAVAFGQILRHRLTQRENAVGGCITVVAIAQRLNPGFNNVPRRFKVRLADAQIDNVLPLRLQHGRPRQHLESVFGTKAG